jgi:hypothetical protein
LLQEYASSNIDASATLFDSANARAVKFTAADTKTITDVRGYFTVNNSPTGYVRAKIYSDSTGPDELIGVSEPVDISTISGTNTAVDFTGLSASIVSGTDYFIAFEVSSTVGGSNDFNVGVDNSSPPDSLWSKVSGSWSSGSGGYIAFQLYNRVESLQVKITSSQESYLEGVGVFYDQSQPLSNNEQLKYQAFSVDTSDNEVTLTLSNFLPVAELLEIHVPERGQVFKIVNGVETLPYISGYDVIFPTDFFYDGLGNTLAVLLVQNNGQTIDTSDANGSIIQENHLGSQDASIDKSVAGKGILLRRPDGTLRELTINDLDQIEIKSVP